MLSVNIILHFFSDIVYVGSVNNTHFDICKLMLENGKHVLCEKPLGVNPGEVKDLFLIAKNNNKFLMEVGIHLYLFV